MHCDAIWHFNSITYFEKMHPFGIKEKNIMQELKHIVKYGHHDPFEQFDSINFVLTVKECE